jgi:basic membrane lipoprotein Med (substrate-binding protein (PBP1-ABC) superfamily)
MTLFAHNLSSRGVEKGEQDIWTHPDGWLASGRLRASDAGCSYAQQPATPQAEAPAASPKKRVKLVINGTLGDKSFFDSAQRGMDMIKNELGYEVRQSS